MLKIFSFAVFSQNFFQKSSIFSLSTLCNPLNSWIVKRHEWHGPTPVCLGFGHVDFYRRDECASSASNGQSNLGFSRARFRDTRARPKRSKGRIMKFSRESYARFFDPLASRMISASARDHRFVSTTWLGVSRDMERRGLGAAGEAGSDEVTKREGRARHVGSEAPVCRTYVCANETRVPND